LEGGRRLAHAVGSSAIAVHPVLAVVELGQVGVVSPTEKPNIGWASIAAERVRLVVMKLQSLSRGAASSVVAHERAPPLIALVDGAPHCSGDVA
jgi:hypothetical protein